MSQASVRVLALICLEKWRSMEIFGTWVEGSVPRYPGWAGGHQFVTCIKILAASQINVWLNCQYAWTEFKLKTFCALRNFSGRGYIKQIAHWIKLYLKNKKPNLFFLQLLLLPWKSLQVFWYFFLRALGFLISLQATIGIDFLSKTMYLEDRTVSKILLLFSVNSRNEDQHLVLCSPHLWDHWEAQAEPSSPSCFHPGWQVLWRHSSGDGKFGVILCEERDNLRSEWWWESGERGTKSLTPSAFDATRQKGKRQIARCGQLIAGSTFLILLV